MTDTSVVVVIHNNKALILRRGTTAPWMPGHWNLPGGCIESGETPEQAAIRECFEETGIEIRDMGTEYTIVDPEFVLHVHIVDFGTEPKVTLCWENDQYCWISAQEIDGYSCVPYVHDILIQALSRDLQKSHSSSLHLSPI